MHAFSPGSHVAKEFLQNFNLLFSAIVENLLANTRDRNITRRLVRDCAEHRMFHFDVI